MYAYIIRRLLIMPVTPVRGNRLVVRAWFRCCRKMPGWRCTCVIFPRIPNRPKL